MKQDKDKNDSPISTAQKITKGDTSDSPTQTESRAIAAGFKLPLCRGTVYIAAHLRRSPVSLIWVAKKWESTSCSLVAHLQSSCVILLCLGGSSQNFTYTGIPIHPLTVVARSPPPDPGWNRLYASQEERAGSLVVPWITPITLNLPPERKREEDGL